MRHRALSSSIQTVLSVPESHRVNALALADFTAGGELHPALKTKAIIADLRDLSM